MRLALIDLDELDKILSNLTGEFEKCTPKERPTFRIAYKVTSDIKAQRCSQPALVELLRECFLSGLKFAEQNTHYEFGLQQFLTQNNLTDEKTE